MAENARFSLFYNYINELNRIRSIPEEGPSELKERYDALCHNLETHTEWIDVYSECDPVSPVGFLIVGHGRNCHPHADYYIEEAYIDPASRRKGLMARCVTEYIRGHYGRYCLFIINNNEVAKQFWFRTMKRLGYVPIELADVGAGDEYCTQYGFAPNQEEEEP